MYNNTENLFLLFSFSSANFLFLTDMQFTDKKSPEEGFYCSEYSMFFFQWSFQFFF